MDEWPFRDLPALSARLSSDDGAMRSERRRPLAGWRAKLN